MKYAETKILLWEDEMSIVHNSSKVKGDLKELSLAIHKFLQALDNAVAEIEFLEKQNSSLKEQIEFAFTFPDGESITLEELCEDYVRLRKQVGEW